MIRVPKVISPAALAKAGKLLCLILLFGGFLQACTGSNTQSLTIAGSTTILPISERWASMYQVRSGNLVNVQGGGSTNGIQLVQKNEVDLGACSRELSAEEEQNIDTIEIGLDAMAVIVHPENEITDLSMQQLRQIFLGKITNWQELGGQDRPVQIVSREAGSGTRADFEQIVFCEGQASCQPTGQVLSSIVVNGNTEVRRNVQLMPGAIGYISFGFLNDSIRAVSVDAVPPTRLNINQKRYPIVRSLYYLKHRDQDSALVTDYLSFVLSPAGQEVLYEEGFSPVYPPGDI